MNKQFDLNELECIDQPLMLPQILVKTDELGFGMSSEPRTGAFLRTLAASKPGGRFLEMGTGTGIATAWLLDGMDRDSKLVSVDTDSQAQAVAKEFLGRDDRLTLVLEDGLHFLRRHQAAIYDFVFADAMPGKYEGLDDCLRVVKNGGFYVIDDMLPQANWPEGHAEKVPVLTRALAEREDFVIVRVSWASGIVVAVRR